MNKKSILVVVAHPDDEILGAGATIHKLSSLGIKVNCLILSSKAEARSTKDSAETLLKKIKSSGDLVGVSDYTLGFFKNIALNTYPHLEVVQFIEDGISKYQPTTIITHHKSDINNDHVITSKACMVAARMYQRQSSENQVHSLLTMEIPSSTNWAYQSSEPYQANYYCHVSKENLEKKINALKAYGDVLRPEPHARSINAINSLAVTRGSECGNNLAESFQSVYGLLPDK
ncbi:PIG-L family deacetylase [Gammaproteobacteria bacterium]|nr:PIG-L family deacetylase [Gammaproteobacteria bacterium]|tara:strand:- start:421 stop:1113 length:693 start_codon:yes stop_codon:yes gene_type:complete